MQRVWINCLPLHRYQDPTDLLTFIFAIALVTALIRLGAQGRTGGGGGIFKATASRVTASVCILGSETLAMTGNSVALCIAVRILGIVAGGILGECAVAALDDIPLAMVLLIDTDLEGIVASSITGTVCQARDATCSVGQVELKIMHSFFRIGNR